MLKRGRETCLWLSFKSWTTWALAYFVALKHHCPGLWLWPCGHQLVAVPASTTGLGLPSISRTQFELTTCRKCVRRGEPRVAGEGQCQLFLLLLCWLCYNMVHSYDYIDYIALPCLTSTRLDLHALSSFTALTQPHVIRVAACNVGRHGGRA